LERERERERESMSSGFSPLAPLGGGATKMATQRCSTEVVDGASMGEMVLSARRRDWSRGERGRSWGAFVMLFIGP
jgi:hypothetical protein